MKNLRLSQDLPISIKDDRVILPFHKGFISTKLRISRKYSPSEDFRIYKMSLCMTETLQSFCLNFFPGQFPVFLVWPSTEQQIKDTT